VTKAKIFKESQQKQTSENLKQNLKLTTQSKYLPGNKMNNVTNKSILLKENTSNQDYEAIKRQ